MYEAIRTVYLKKGKVEKIEHRTDLKKKKRAKKK